MSRNFRKAALALGLLGLLAVIVSELVRWHSLVFGAEPRLSWKCLAHTFLTALSVLCLLIALKPREGSPLLENVSKPGSWVRWGAAALLLAGVGIVALIFLEPGLFRQWTQEDSLIEWGSACFLFAAGAVFAGAAFRTQDRGIIRWTTFFLMGAMWFAAMEEVSWFQRVLKYPTPSAFACNCQHEFNLHNFSTNAFEGIYFAGTFFLLVVLPFFKDGLSWLPGFRHAERFIACPLVATVATLPNAFNYDMWNALVGQGTFFACLGFLSLRGLGKWGREGKNDFGMVLLLVGAQVVFLTHKSFCGQTSNVGEYQEFLAAMLWWVYALDVSARIHPWKDVLVLKPVMADKT
jgi:hypothetical protein